MQVLGKQVRKYVAKEIEDISKKLKVSQKEQKTQQRLKLKEM